MTVRDALTLEQLDRDGALLEAVAALHGDTRAEFLRKAAVGRWRDGGRPRGAAGVDGRRAAV